MVSPGPDRNPLVLNLGKYVCADCGSSVGVLELLQYSGPQQLWSDDKAKREAAKADWDAHIFQNPFVRPAKP